MLFATKTANVTGSDMRILLNGKEAEFENCKTVADLIEQIDSLPQLFVIEKNQNIIYKEDYASEGLNEGDSVEVVAFTGGG